MTNIPRSFKFAGITFNVEIVHDICNNDESEYADFDTNTNTIRLARTIDKEYVTEQTMINSYYHELAHALQYYYNNQLDETFAQCIGNFLMEYNQTVEYGKKE